jgi:hypothetical protein
MMRFWRQLGLCAVLLGSSALARAEDAEDAAKDGSNDRAATFEAVSGAVKEDVPGGPLLVAAYGLIWLAVFAYGFRLVRLQRGADENLARLQQDLAKATKQSE